MVESLAIVDTWDVPNVAVAVVGPGGTIDGRGPQEHSFRIASVAKLLIAYAGLVALEEGSISLDEPAGREGATPRHLLSHAAGYAFDGDEPIARVGSQRIYSNTAMELFVAHLEARTGIAYEEYLREGVLRPLGMAATEVRGSPAYNVWSTLADLTGFVRELLRPQLIDASTLAQAVEVQFGGLRGILPDVGRFDPLDWGLGFERNFSRPGHWAGSVVSPRAFGHFGGAGTFLIVDPAIDRGVVCLTDREFGPWALEAWPPFCDAVLAESGAAAA